jgi:hypothetical protein
MVQQVPGGYHNMINQKTAQVNKTLFHLRIKERMQGVVRSKFSPGKKSGVPAQRAVAKETAVGKFPVRVCSITALV